MLKAVDPTYTVNTKKTFQARNAKAYEVEIPVAPSRMGAILRTDKPVPVALPEREWLLHGRFVDHVVVCRDGSPARIVAPDPRWFALQKLWMSEQAKRNALKRPKDLKQGIALLDSVHLTMPQYPVDADLGRSSRRASRTVWTISGEAAQTCFLDLVMASFAIFALDSPWKTPIRIRTGTIVPYPLRTLMIYDDDTNTM